MWPDPPDRSGSFRAGGEATLAGQVSIFDGGVFGLRQLVKRSAKRGAAVLDPVEFARTRLKFEPDEVQADILRSKAKRGILCCTRQFGKTTVSAAKAIHRAVTEPGSLIVVTSPGERQSGIWMRCAAEMLARLGIRKRGDGYNRLSLALPNGSRIVGLPDAEEKVRGFSGLSMLFVDEAARVPEEMYTSVWPMLAISDGDFWMMSTPYGKRGYFYEEWAHGSERWKRVFVPATECGRIRKDFLEEQRSTLPIDKFRQEYLCEFLGSGTGMFDRDLIEAALSDEIEPL